MLDNFILIPIPLPPMLPRMVGVHQNTHYFSIHYYGNKATWFDGWQTDTFSYYGVFEPLTYHVAIAAYVSEAHLGSDEAYPTHSILCDRLAQKMYVGDYEKVRNFIKSHRPSQPTRNFTLEEIIQLQPQTQIKIYPPTQEEFNRKGMMEMCGRIAPNLQVERDRLVQWLDAQVTPELIERVVEESTTGISPAEIALGNYLHRNTQRNQHS